MHRYILVASCLTSTLATQTTSPAAVPTVEGNHAVELFPFGIDRRFQQLDATHAGNPMLIKSIALRRDGIGPHAAPARLVDVEISLGECNLTLPSSRYDYNYLSSGRVVAFSRKTVQLPDWSQAAGSPAAFDARFVLDQPFSYSGGGGLVIDVTATNCRTAPGGVSGVGGMLTDAFSTLPSVAPATYTGVGCTIAGRSAPFLLAMRMENHGSNFPSHSMRMRNEVWNGPANAPILIHFDVQDPALPVPWLCSTVRALPLHRALLANTDSTGHMPQIVINCPYLPTLIGVRLFVQAATVDPGQAPLAPVVLSNGAAATMPASSNPTGHDIVFHTGPAAQPDAELQFATGLAIELGR